MQNFFLDFDDQRISGDGELWRLEFGAGHWSNAGPARPEAGSDNWRNFAVLLERAADMSPAGGAIGYVGYESVRPEPFENYPICRFIGFNQLTRQSVPTSQHSQPALELPVGPSQELYRRQVEAIQDYIRSGDIYQANLTHEFRGLSRRSPIQIYERLRSFGPTPRGALLDFGDLAVISNSPESFLSLHHHTLVSTPIKGTIRRGETPKEDAFLAETLLRSPKDRAENVMIVDLLRNDLGRVCEYGSVTVPGLFEIQSFPTLHHLVSTVQGRLRHGTTALEAFLACFPCGSITGAPKIRAMEIIEEVETGPRGVPMGAIGYFGFDGSLDFNVAIRTAVWRPDFTTFHAGGGIVADSRWQDEYNEMMLKAGAVWTAAFGA